MSVLRENMNKKKTISEISIWHRDVEIPKYSALQGNLETDIAVIGGGLVGILTAYELMRRGRNVVVLEALRIASGQTEGTTAKITGQHGLIYDKLVRNYGFDKAHTYALFHQQMIDAYEKIIREGRIDCEFERTDSWLYTCKEDVRLLKKEAETAKRLGLPSTFETDSPLPFPITGAVRFANQAQFHPLRFLKALSEKLTVYEDTKVERVHGHRLVTNRGIVKANRIIFACHYPFLIAPGWYPLRMSQKRSYVLALGNVQKWEGMFYGLGRDELSYRFAGDILLAGGGGHRTGELSETCGFQYLKEQVLTRFPDAEILAKWSAQDCMTHDELPFIGKYSVLRPWWYVATGLKKWGMTGAMACAKILSHILCGPDMETGDRNEERASVIGDAAELFSPQRFHLRAGLPSFTEHLAVNGKGLTKGNLLFRKPRCPHMGCQLVWNKENHTWECPCHGSEFEQNGILLSGPAKRTAEVSEITQSGPRDDWEL